MSTKIQSFMSVIANPANLHRFRIHIPNVDDTIIAVVESTIFPSPNPIREISLWAQGEQIRYPGQPENGGVWTFKIPESADFKVVNELDKWVNKIVNWKTGEVHTVPMVDILVQSLDLEDKPAKAVRLMQCWVKNRQNINLNAADPNNAWKWDYAVVFNWIDPM